jgi:hypothetical protein
MRREEAEGNDGVVGVWYGWDILGLSSGRYTC